MNVDLLLDTHMAIWFAEGDERALAPIADVVDDPTCTITVSVTSWIEVAIKHATGKLHTNVASVRAALVGNGFLELPIRASHAAALEQLPLHHRDPFDRLLAAQAIAEEMTLVTADREFAPYTGDGLALQQA